MSKWLYNLIVSSINAKKTGVIKICLFEGGISNVVMEESFKQPKNVEIMNTE